MVYNHGIAQWPLNYIVFVACGLNHKTAPLEVREKIALAHAMQEDKLLTNLMGEGIASEATLLSTCNRTEVYCHTQYPEQIASWLVSQQQLTPAFLSPYLYTHSGHEAVRHTLRVASGLDSMMLGEPQILGQMKKAYLQGCRLGAVKNNLRHVFPYVFSASKRVRSRSGIGTNPVSIAFAAVQLIKKFFSNNTNLKVFIIGSGETAALVAKYLNKEGVKDFFIASRSSENAELLASTIKGKSLAISDIPQYLYQADVVISATACPLPFINKHLVEHALAQRQQAPMFFLDLAVPRDIEAAVAELTAVTLYNIDDLQFMIEKGMDERRSAAFQAEQLIDCELENYIRWRRSLDAKKVICDYRYQMQNLAHQELQRAQEKLLAGGIQTQVLEEFCERLVNKLTHYPSVGLRQAAWDGREELVDLASYLFKPSLA